MCPINKKYISRCPPCRADVPWELVNFSKTTKNLRTLKKYLKLYDLCTHKRIDHSINTEIANIHFHAIACTRLFDSDLTLAERQKA